MYSKDGENYFVVDAHTHFWDASPANWVPRCISAVRTLQPLWSQPEAKPPRFEDGLDRAKSRFAGILSDIGLQAPKELNQ